MSSTPGSPCVFQPEPLDGVDAFIDTPVKPEDLEFLLCAAGDAPSIANSQPWEFIITTSATRKAEMARTLLDVQFRQSRKDDADVSWFIEAPIVMTVMMNRLRAKAKIGPEGADRFALMDIGMALACMLQKGRVIGIGSTIIREFDRVAISRICNLPKHLDPLLLVALGYMAAPPRSRPRLHLDEYVRWDTDGETTDAGV